MSSTSSPGNKIHYNILVKDSGLFYTKETGIRGTANHVMKIQNTVLTTCAVSCEIREDCVAFNYNEADGECQLTSDATNSESSAGWSRYT